MVREVDVVGLAVVLEQLLALLELPPCNTRTDQRLTEPSNGGCGRQRPTEEAHRARLELHVQFRAQVTQHHCSTTGVASYLRG
jgi:hypothetical protein